MYFRDMTLTSPMTLGCSLRASRSLRAGAGNIPQYGMGRSFSNPQEKETGV